MLEQREKVRAESTVKTVEQEVEVKQPSSAHPVAPPYEPPPVDPWYPWRPHPWGPDVTSPTAPSGV